MQIPWYGITNILVTLTSLAICAFVFIKGARNKTNKIWSALTLLIAMYGFGAYMVSLADNSDSAFFWWQVSYVGIIMIPVLFMHFVCSFLGLSRCIFLKTLYSVSFLLLALNIFSPKLFLGRVSIFFTDSNYFKAGYWVYPPGPLLVFFIIFIFFGTAAWAHLELIRGYAKAPILRRNQIKYFFLGTAMGFIGGGTSFLPCFNIKLYPIFNIAVAFYPLITSYAIIKYRLMDIRMAITRTGIFIAVYTLVLGLPFALSTFGQNQMIRLLGINWWVGPLILMGALGIVGPFVYIRLKISAEAILFREQLRYQKNLRQAAEKMTSILNLKKLLSFITHTLTMAVRIEHASIYLYEAKADAFTLNSGRNLRDGQPVSIDKKSPLVVWVEGRKKPLVYEEIKRKGEEESDISLFLKGLEQQAQLLSAKVAIPAFVESRLAGIIILGDKRSGRVYSSEDLNAFLVLASQAALAIANASLYGDIEGRVNQRTKELAEMQKQLVQAEKLASVGILAGGVAHEINNPLTAILTNAQMLLAEGNSLDPDSRESLELIEEATKRCRDIVQKLMFYARKPLESGEVSKIDVLKAVRNVVSFLNYQLTQENVKVVFDSKDSGNYFVLGNQNELEQVITNIILNAHDAIRHAKKNGLINIALHRSSERVRIEIKDDGIGIRKEIISRIFDPFFTTKDVGKGLGLGLSICQAIIEKHNGRISVHSELNMGSEFSIHLPAA